MWLLNTTTITLRNFIANVPDYVILSHTWGSEEVTFDDIGKPDVRAELKGYAKVIGCCKQAVNDGFEWAWIDTCCIDKRSSAELSEAINSMYRWYWDAAICYAYLEDVNQAAPWVIGTSNWFRRGWTLQELLAPAYVEFYTRSWAFIGTKGGLLKVIRRVTRIDEGFLEDRQTIRAASIATKFGWASRRKTTRTEDMAYCLLGLVGINMPMLYGEGTRAFYRLQLEILKQTNDHTIFAWESPFDEMGVLPVTAVLAPSPSYFFRSEGIEPIRTPRSKEALTHEVTNNGLRITLPFVKVNALEYVAFLHCENSKGENVGVRLQKLENKQYQRSPGSTLVDLSQYEDQPGKLRSVYLVLESEEKEDHTALGAHSGRPTGFLSHIAGIRGDCGYRIESIVLSSRTEFADIDPYEFARKEFRVPYDTLACISLTSATWHPTGMAIVLSYSRGGHPLITQTKLDKPIEDVLKIEWARLMNEPSKISEEMGTSQSDFLHTDYGQRTLIQVKPKRRMHYHRPMWTFGIETFQCVCAPWEYLDTSPPKCTCSTPPVQPNETFGCCFCTMCRFRRHLEAVMSSKKQSGGVEMETQQDAHVMECSCRNCQRESKAVAVSGPECMPGYKVPAATFANVPEHPKRTAGYDRSVARSRWTMKH